VDWTPGGVSSDVEDRRDSSGGGGGFGFGGGGGLGIAGFVVVLIISLVTGHNFLGGLLGGGGGSAGYEQPNQGQYGPAVAGQERTPRAHPPGEDRDVQLISFVLDDAQKTWTQIFDEAGKNYRHAKLVIYRNRTYSGCGTAEAQTGPFYCPADEKIYIDLSFWDELKRFGGDTGDFAQAYVVAHELGHHVQKLLGIEQKEQRLVQENPGERNEYSVDLELQADCFAGVWAHTTEQRGFVHPNDVAGALRAAAAVGDDHLQEMSGRAVSPESWTHGSSAQRETWFRRGLNSGKISACDTFGAEAGRGE
jgi:predicted metalloprotease